jgi:hypothetical protein
MAFASFWTSSAVADAVYLTCLGTFDSSEPYVQVNRKAGPIAMVVDQENASISVGGQQPWAIAKDGTFAGSFVDQTGLWGGVRGAQLFMDGHSDPATGTCVGSYRLALWRLRILIRGPKSAGFAA